MHPRLLLCVPVEEVVSTVWGQTVCKTAFPRVARGVSSQGEDVAAFRLVLERVWQGRESILYGNRPDAAMRQPQDPDLDPGKAGEGMTGHKYLTKRTSLRWLKDGVWRSEVKLVWRLDGCDSIGSSERYQMSKMKS